MHRASLALVVAGTLASAGACSSGSASKATSKAASTSAPASGTTKRSRAADACASVTVEDATALFGEPARSKPATSAPTGGVASECVYEATNDASGQLLQVRVFDGDRYYSRALFPTAHDLQGLGTEAYVNPQGPGGIVDLQFVQGGKVYALAYSNLSNDAPAKAAALEALARRVAGGSRG